LSRNRNECKPLLCDPSLDASSSGSSGSGRRAALVPLTRDPEDIAGALSGLERSLGLVDPDGR
jgi:hypothetical protein